MPEEIMRQDVLYRRIFRSYIVTHENNRISSAAFKKDGKKPDPECSVYVERLVSDPAEPMWSAARNQVLVQLSASEPLSRNIPVTHDPVPADSQRPETPPQPGHAIMGITTKSQCGELAEVSRLVSRASKFYGET